MSEHPLAPHRPALKVHIVGGGITGLAVALALLWQARRLGLPLEIVVYEGTAFGGGGSSRAASWKCQLWLHAEGVIFFTQPAVALALQKSTRQLKRWVPGAFRQSLALTVDPPGDGPSADLFFQALGIKHRAVSRKVVQRWFPSMQLRAGTIWRVRDGVIDLRLSAAMLAHQAAAQGAALVRQPVDRLDLRGERVARLHFANRQSVAVGEQDVVVLACGAAIRPLLGKSGLTVAGLRLFQSHLVATEDFGLRVLASVLRGGANMVPHETAEGRVINVFGNTERIELPAEEDRKPLHVDGEAVKRLKQEIDEEFGLRLGEGCMSWPAVKTEIVHDGMRSQLHHAFRLPELNNLYIAIPGKLSQAAACGEDLAVKVVREMLGSGLARPIWEFQPQMLAVNAKVA